MVHYNYKKLSKKLSILILILLIINPVYYLINNYEAVINYLTNLDIFLKDCDGTGGLATQLAI
jgi:hypothetical protein